MGSACLVLAAVLIAGSGQALSLSQYRHAVHVQRLALDRLVAHPDARPLERARIALRSLDAVRLPDGSVVHTDLPVLAEQLAMGDPASVRRVAARLDALDVALGRSHVGQASRAHLAMLDTVLKDSRFHPPRPPWAPLTDKIAELQNRLLEWLLTQTSDRAGSAGVFAILLLLAVAGFGYLLARGTLARLVVDVSAENAEDAPTTSASAQELAQSSSAAGDYREALRYLFLATLLALQERGLVDLRPGMTNREYIAAIRDAKSSSGVMEPLTALVDTFERVWYGHMPITPAEYNRCRDDVARGVSRPTRGAA